MPFILQVRILQFKPNTSFYHNGNPNQDKNPVQIDSRASLQLMKHIVVQLCHLSDPYCNTTCLVGLASCIFNSYRIM